MKHKLMVALVVITVLTISIGLYLREEHTKRAVLASGVCDANGGIEDYRTGPTPHQLVLCKDHSVRWTYFKEDE